MDYDQLKLSNQICFPVYAASRLITKEYQPHLDQFGITYPQYLVLLILWETNPIPVNDIAKKMILNTNTVTPLLKRMEIQGWTRREKNDSDERKVWISLTNKGLEFKHEAAKIPELLLNSLKTYSMELDHLLELRDQLNQVIEVLVNKK